MRPQRLKIRIKNFGFSVNRRSPQGNSVVDVIHNELLTGRRDENSNIVNW